MNAIENIIQENELLVYSIVNQFANNNNRDDLYQVGIVGLIKAHRNFKMDMNAKFSTYAYKYILGEIKHYLLENKAVKVNRQINSLYLKIEKVRLLMCQKLMREPTVKEISNFLEIEENIIEEAMKVGYSIESIDAPVKIDGKEVTLHDYVPDLKNKSREELMDLKSELLKLSEFDQKIILHRYIEDLTQQEVADILGVNQVQISRDENKILSKLRKRLT